jgi:hypothetical protein
MPTDTALNLARGMIRGAGLFPTVEDTEALAADIELLQREDMPDAMLHNAAVELARRVGHGNLASYLDCIRPKS